MKKRMSALSIMVILIITISVVFAESTNIMDSESTSVQNSQKIKPLSDPSEALWYNIDEINIANPKSPKYGKYPIGERYPSGERAATHYYWGASWDGGFDEGAFAYQEMHGDLELGSTTSVRYLYAPTLVAPDPCPLESVTAYIRTKFDSETARSYRVHTFNDTWTGTEWTRFPIIIDYDDFSDFLEDSAYGECYYTDIVNNFDDTWSVYLWNFTANNWQGIITVDEVNPSARAPNVSDDGWNIWEGITWSTSWPDLPEIRSDNLMIYNGESWVDCTYYWGGRLFQYLPGNFDEPKTWNDYYYDWEIG